MTSAKTAGFLTRLLPLSALLAVAQTHGHDLRSLGEAYKSARHNITSVGDGHRTRNVRQSWTIEFDGRGFSTSEAWGLELLSVGFEDSPELPKSEVAHPSADANRLVYRWSEDVREWFVNDDRGLQQGWTIVRRPVAGTSTHLTLRLAIRGHHKPEVNPDLRSVTFKSADGRSNISYGGLLAWDAEGRILPATFVSTDGEIQISVDERDATYPITIDPVAQNAYLKASNTGVNDLFGTSVAVSGNTAVIGASEEDSSAVGVNGNAADNSANNAGAAYVFIRENGVWTQQAYLKASNTGALDNFGEAVAISGDTIVIGAPAEDGSSTGIDGPDNDGASASGAAYVFHRVAGVWSQQAYLKASNTGTGDRFGASVSIDGDTIVVGAPFEDSSSTGVNGGNNNLAAEAGAAYVFHRVAGAWSQQAYLKASNTGADDRFGIAVSVSGDRVAVGAYQEDTTAADSGAAYTYSRAGGVWSFDQMLKASNAGAGDEYGTAVSVSGNSLAVGAPFEDSPASGVNGSQGDGTANSGAVYVLVRGAANWTQQAYLKPSTNSVGNEFGDALALSGNALIVGAHFEDSDSVGINGSQENLGALSSGAAYVFQRNGTTWFQEAYLKASNTQSNDRFGCSVAIDGTLALVGARFEDSSATGINGDQASNAALDSGAAYAFIVTPGEFVAPTLKVNGGKTIRTSARKVVIRGKASDASGIARVEYKAGKGGFKAAKFNGSTWKAVVRFKGSKRRVVAQIRAVDGHGNFSKIARVKVLRR